MKRDMDRIHQEALNEDKRRQRERLKSLQDGLTARARANDQAHKEALNEDKQRNQERLRVLRNSLARRTRAILEEVRLRQQEMDRAHAEALRVENAHQRELNRAHGQALRERRRMMDRAHAEALRERQRTLNRAHAEALQVHQQLESVGERMVATGRRIGRRFGTEIALEIRRIPILPFMLAAFAPAIAALTKILSAFAAEAVALLAPVGPAIASSLAVGAQGATAFAQGVGAAIAALTTEGERLDAFEDRLENTKDRFRELGRDIQAVTLDTFIENIERATDSIMPRFRSEMVQTGRVLADASDRFGDLSEDPFFTARLGTILSSNNRVLESLSRAGVALADALATVLAAASPLTEQFADYAARTAEGWAESLRLAQATGDLADWFRRAGEFLEQLGRIGENTRRALSETFQISNRNARSLWDGIEGLTERWREFTESTRGQSRINQFFEQSRRITSEVTRLFGDAFSLIGEGIISNSDALVSFIRTIRLQGLPAIADMASAFSGLGPVFNDLVVAAADFLRVLTESGVVATFITTLRDLFTTISDLLSLPVVGQLAQWSLAFLAFGRAMNLVTLGAFTRALRPLAGRLGEVGGAITQVGRQAVTAAGRGGLGALRGSAGLLAGALGGPVGLAITGVTVGLGFLLKAHLDAKNAAAEHEAQMLEFADTLDEATGAVTRQTGEWVANEIATRGYGDELSRLGVSSETFTRAALGNAEALEQVHAAIDEDQVARANALWEKGSEDIKAFEETMSIAGVTQSDFTSAVAEGGDALSSMLGQLGPENRNQTVDRWRSSVENLSESNSDLEEFIRETNAAIEEERDRIREVAEASGTTSLEVQTLADSIGILGDEFSSADEKARALDDALNVLSGGERDVEAANRRLHQSFRDVDDALVDTAASAERGETVYFDLSSAIDDATGKLDQSTEVGGILGDTYERLFDNAEASALAIAESGGNASEVRQPFEDLEAEMRELLDTAGATPEEIDAVLSSLQSLPTQTIVDLIMNSDQFDDPVAGAQQTLAELDGTQAIAELVGDDIDLAHKIVQNRDDLDAFNSIVATATADLDDDEAQVVYDQLLAALANLNRQNPTATADIDPRLLEAEKARIDEKLDELNSQEPTPTTELEIRAFEARRRQVLSQLNALDNDGASPEISATNNASSVIGTVLRDLASIPNRVSTTIVSQRVSTSGPEQFLASGGVVAPGGRLKTAADGMLADRAPMVAKGGSNIMWAEPQTHAESYIPWAPSKRSRATRILDRTASEFGFRLNPQADGGIVARTQSLLSQSSTGTAAALPSNAPPVFQFTVDGPEVQYRAEQIAQESFKQYRRDQAVRGRVPRG